MFGFGQVRTAIFVLPLILAACANEPQSVPGHPFFDPIDRQAYATCQQMLYDAGFVRVERGNNLVERAMQTYSRQSGTPLDQLYRERCAGFFAFGKIYCVGIATTEYVFDGEVMYCYPASDLTRHTLRRTRRYDDNGPAVGEGAH